MATEPKRWPNNAQWARDGAVQELVTVVRMLHPLVVGEGYDRTETLRRQAAALAAAQSALVQLVQVGARVASDQL